jgi:hypothetical protein
MRQMILILSLAALAGCGGDDGGPTMLESVSAAVIGNDHSCARPAPSGSAEQKACHEAARASCPEGTMPKRIDFVEEGGQFLVRGYSCA